jgi:hypothetical protein
MVTTLLATQSISGKKFSIDPLPPACFFSIDPCLPVPDHHAGELKIL